MNYSINDIVTLKGDYVYNGGTISKGSKGTVVEVKSSLEQYKVTFENHGEIWLSDSDLE